MFNMNTLESFDHWAITHIRKLVIPFARVSLFVVYFWFGILKLVGSSPANPLVAGLLERTMPFITFDHFIIFLGSVEILIAVAFLVPSFERWAIALLIPHLITTFMPLVLLPAMAWQGPFIPTLEGQYIIKNLLIIASALAVAASLRTQQEKHYI